MRFLYSNERPTERNPLLCMFEMGNEYAQYINTFADKQQDERSIADQFNRSGYGLPPNTFCKAVNKFDEMRGTDFHKTFPELKLFWDFCNTYV